MSIQEIGVIVSFIASFLVIIAGFIFSRRSKASEQIKRNISMGAYLLGGVSMVINGFQLGRIINGTFKPSDLPQLPMLPELPELPNTTTTTTHMVELFGMNLNLFNLINIGAGIVIILIGLIFKEKKWSKIAILLGVMAIVAGAFQILL